MRLDYACRALARCRVVAPLPYCEKVELRAKTSKRKDRVRLLRKRRNVLQEIITADMPKLHTNGDRRVVAVY